MKKIFINYLEGILHINELRKNKNLVFTNGCFDILHTGHLKYLKLAKELGDLLVVGLNTDESIKRLKGEKRPIVNQYDRAFILSSLEFVDFVLLFSENTPINLIKLLKPEIYVKGGDYTIENLPEYKIVKNYNGKVKILPFFSGLSTTSIIEKILFLYCKKEVE